MITNTGRCAVVVAAVGPLLVIMNPVRWSWRTTPWSDKTAGPRGTRRFELKSAAPQQTSHPHEPQPRTTLPAFRHEVQTFSFRTVPGATCARTGWMFGSHRRWVRRWEWDTFIPKPGPLPHTSHTAATPNTPIDVVRSTTGRPEHAREGPACAGQPHQGTDPRARHQIPALLPSVPVDFRRGVGSRRTARAGGRQGWVNGTGWCTMDTMTSFDAELVDLWFGCALDSNHPLMPFWGIHPTEEESTVIVDGRRQVQAAIGPSRQDSTPESVPESSAVRPTELAARMLQSYLSAVAAGVAETRRTLAGAGADTAPGGEPIGDPGSLALVAGLNAGAAALYS